MSWPFRATVLVLLLALGVAPQLACFMPDQTATQSDMDCCKEMIGACTAPNMSHECCQVAAPTVLGLAAKTVHHVALRFHVVEVTTDVASDLRFRLDNPFSRYSDPAPPDKHGEFSLIRRI